MMARATTTVAALAGLCGAAMAGPMMPLGNSPEAGLAGGWRIIEAKPAPWSKPRTLSKADAPLLEYGVDFVKGAVKGPAPLACAAAKYSSGVTYLDEAFGGRLTGEKARRWPRRRDLGTED